MTGRKAERFGPTRARVLLYLRDTGQSLPVARVAAAVGLHPNTTRFHLEALIEAGVVTRSVEQRDRPGRPKVVYQAVPGYRGDHYERLATALVHQLAAQPGDPAEKARDVGMEWGSRLRTERDAEGRLAPVERLVDGMVDLGFQPRFAETPEPTVVLRPCPYLGLVDAAPEVICELHVGLASGLLGPNQPWQVTGIEPRVTPSSCVLHLAQAGGSSPQQDGRTDPPED